MHFTLKETETVVDEYDELWYKYSLTFKKSSTQLAENGFPKPKHSSNTLHLGNKYVCDKGNFFSPWNSA